MGDHGVAAAEWVVAGAQRVVLGGGLGEPDITTVASEVARFDGLGDVLLDDNGATGGVDEVRAWDGVVSIDGEWRSVEVKTYPSSSC